VTFYDFDKLKLIGFVRFFKFISKHILPNKGVGRYVKYSFSVLLRVEGWVYPPADGHPSQY